VSPRPAKLRLVDAPPGDDAAREAIRTELDKNFVVEAAAGTGKTTELVNRIVAVLRAGRATVDHVVGVTFTEKAAGELKLRLREGLERARQETKSKAERRHLEHALARLEEAWVGTIHGFCAEILRERSVEAGVDPNFEVLTDPEARRTFREGFRRWLEEQLSAPPEGVRRSLRRTAPRSNADDGPIARLESAGWTLAEWRDFDAPWRRDPFDRAAQVDAVVEALNAYAELAECCTNPARDVHHKASAPARMLSLEIRTAESVRARDYDGVEARLVDLARNRDFCGAPPGYGDRYAPHVLRADLLARHAALVQSLADFQRRADADLASLLQRELRGAISRYETIKHRRGQLDFVDLLIGARDLIRDRADVRAAFRARFTHLFVDEFQDTDPLQAEILMLLAASDPAERVWTRAVPDPGKLFLVGDPKQAIYRFRRADVGIYGQVKEQLERTGATSVQLTTSFRAVRSIQNALNATFAPRLDGDERAQQADYVPLDPVRPDHPGQPAVVALPVPAPYGMHRLAKSSVDASLPGAVAAFVDWLLNESGWTVTERERPGERVPILARHVCLLFRRFDDFWTGNVTREYVSGLEARGIRHLLVGGHTYHEREEVEALRTALVAVEWPDDELSVFAALHGPLYAILDETLLEYRHLYGRLHPFRRPPATPERLEPVAAALAQLAELHRHRNERPIAETLHSLLEATRAHAGFAFQPSGEQVLANVLHMAEQARAYEKTGGLSFRGFVEQLLEDDERRSASEAPILEEGSDGVRIMTVHKAKGLEFPVVILADITARIARLDPSRLVDPARRLCALKLAGWTPAELLERQELEVDRDVAEGVRIAYVAATRARDLLVVPAVADFERGQPWDGGARDSQGRWRWAPFWTSPLQGAIYPRFDERGAAADAPGCPRFGADPTVDRPSPEPADCVKPGLHDLGHGYGVVWWDPHTLELEPPPHHGLRRDDLIDKTVDPAIVESDRLAHLAWQEDRAAAIARASAPGLRVTTVTERAMTAGGAARTDRDGPVASGARPGAGSATSLDEAAARVTIERIGASGTSEAARGVRFGALVHAVLATVALDANPSAVLTTSVLQARILGASEEEVEAAVKAVGAVLAHPLLDRARRAHLVRRETPVTFVDDDGVVVDGKVDLAFEEADGWTVVDFKTSREMEPDAALQRRQLALYARGIAQATGTPARGIVLVV
jgi:ATP-dependent helicase/nuclease subunit A